MLKLRRLYHKMYSVAESKFPIRFLNKYWSILSLQRRVIRRWNANFASFQGIISKIVKKNSMKRNLHFSGKWQNRANKPITRYG